MHEKLLLEVQRIEHSLDIDRRPAGETRVRRSRLSLQDTTWQDNHAPRHHAPVVLFHIVFS